MGYAAGRTRVTGPARVAEMPQLAGEWTLGQQYICSQDPSVLTEVPCR
jgi:hypothetical protein